MKTYFTLVVSLISSFIFGQTTADFENFDLPSSGFLNNAPQGVFTSGPIFLPNEYNSEFDFWGGWAISNSTDATTPGFLNQYSAISGEGFNGSSNYALTYAFTDQIIGLNESFQGAIVEGIYITNSTYAALSMLNGDAVSKQFGGLSGNDPDFFLLTVRGYSNGVLTNETVQFFLADYTFSNNSQDYIVDDWTFVDLSTLGPVDSLLCSLSSSDVGSFGMNTPAYFCIDNVIVSQPVSAPFKAQPEMFEFFPNPATNLIRIKSEAGASSILRLLDINGRQVHAERLSSANMVLDVSRFESGTYLLRVENEGQTSSQTLIIQ